MQLHKAHENLREQVTIGFGFTCDWLRKWREIFKSITERCNAKPKETQITFDTHVKIALSLQILFSLSPYRTEKKT